jgi:DNA invertase Pin-like site-specific DNA recombinase
MAVRKKNRGLAYLRRSTDRQEISFPTQLDWAHTEAERHSVNLEASQADLDFMLGTRQCSYKDLRVDDGISGADPTRPGFLALIEDARSISSISHLFIYRRDRLARPDDAIKMVSVEKELRYAGITMVFAEGVASPLDRGQADLAADIAMMVGYYESGEFLRKHAERVLLSQRQLALGGYRVGGNAPYGFTRVLVDSAGNILEELPPGRRVRQLGCHVRIVPKDANKIATWVLILELNYKGWGYKKIARHLNELSIPSPGAGSLRTDQGVRHIVSGRWGPNTVKELCENRAILGLQDYGRRSEGAHRRLGRDGPRLLNETDRGASDRP